MWNSVFSWKCEYSNYRYLYAEQNREHNQINNSKMGILSYDSIAATEQPNPPTSVKLKEYSYINNICRAEWYHTREKKE